MIARVLLWCLLCAAPVEARTTEPARVLVVAAGDVVALEVPEPGARVEAALDGGALRPVAGSVTAPASGDHWLAVASRDQAGNLSPVRWLRLRVDTEPPRFELATRPAPVIGEDGRWWLPPGAEVEARAEDDLAGVSRVALGIGEELREVEGAVLAAPLPPAGEVVVRGRAVDRVGNLSPEALLELAIDGEPPTGEILVAGAWVAGEGGGLEGAVLAPSCGLEAELRDGESGLARWSPRTDGAEVAAGAWRGPWSPGAHAVEAVAADRVGNEGRVGPFRFTVDGEGPEISWRVVSAGVTGAGGESYYLPPVEVTAEGRDVPAGLEELRASLDGDTFERLEVPITVDGDRLHLEATDRVGNRTEVDARWRLDLEPPEVRIAAPAGGSVGPGGRMRVRRGDELAVEVIDRGAGVERATYVMDRGWAIAPPMRPLSDRIGCRRTGRFRLTIEAVDRLGNVFRGDWEVAVRRKGD